MDFMEFMKHALKVNGKNEIVIGRVPNSILKEFREFLDDKEYLQATYEIRKKQIMLDAEQKLKDEFQSRLDMIGERHDYMWGKIYEEFDLDPNGEYSYNRSTNEIVEYADVEKEKEVQSSPFHT